jgi:hypothetical protein
MKTPHLLLATLALAGGAAADATPRAAPAEVHPLDLRALYVEEGGRLALAPAVTALSGQRVRVQGFMVQMEESPRGEFYLATHPVEQDESGGGTADIPAASVLVRVPELAAEQIPWRPNAVEVVGTLEVGREEDAEGRVSTLRVILAGPQGG